MNNSSDGLPENDFVQFKLISVSILLVMCFVAFVANVYVLLSCRYIPAPKKPIIIIVLSLSAADCWTTVLMATTLTVHSLLPHLVTTPRSPAWTCSGFVLEALRLGSVGNSVLHLLLLASNHYFATARPIKYQSNQTLSPKLRITLFAVWIIPPVFYVAAYSVLPGHGLTSPNCAVMDYYMTIKFRVYTSLFVFIPLFIMIGFYLAMYYEMNRKDKRQMVAPENNTRRKRYLTTSILIVLSFLICWLPGAIWHLMTCETCPFNFKDKASPFRRQIPRVSIVVNGLIIFKGLINPILYAARIPEIRKAVERMHFRTTSHHNPSNGRGGGVSQLPSTSSFCRFQLPFRRSKDTSIPSFPRAEAGVPPTRDAASCEPAVLCGENNAETCLSYGLTLDIPKNRGYARVQTESDDEEVERIV